MQSHIADLYDTRGSICVAHERLSTCCATAAGEGRDDCYPARVHATLDLLDRHLATMKDQLTPKPLVGRAPPKKVVSARHLYSVAARLLLMDVGTTVPKLLKQELVVDGKQLLHSCHQPDLCMLLLLLCFCCHCSTAGSTRAAADTCMVPHCD